MIDFAINVEMLYPGMDICEKSNASTLPVFRPLSSGAGRTRILQNSRRPVSIRASKCVPSAARATGRSATVSTAGLYRLDQKTIEVAKDLECDTLILFPNHFTPNGCADFRSKYSHEAMIANITAYAYQAGAGAGGGEYDRAVEPICNIGSDGGMSVTDTSVGADIVRAVGSPSGSVCCAMCSICS